jgi:DNA-binding NarL/FixJ family response regulator
MITVLIVDDNDVIRMGLRSLLEAVGAAQVVGEANNGKVALERARELRPQVTLLDVRMPVMGGLEAVKPLAALTKVLMMTYADDDEVVAAAIRSGASGYLVHGQFGPDELGEAVRRVAAGGSALSPAVAPALFDAVRSNETTAPPTAREDVRTQLTQREAEILDHIARGLSNADIAQTLFVDEKTVKNHINRAYAKLHVGNRGEAIATWLGTRRGPH